MFYALKMQKKKKVIFLKLFVFKKLILLLSSF